MKVIERMEYTVLIIDDDSETHALLSEYLRLAGFRVYQARDGLQGVEMVQTLKPDVVLLDLQLPGVDGFQILDRMQASSILKQIAVLFISRSNRTNLKVKSLEKGADDFICKPFERVEVLARIKVVLRRVQQQKMEKAVAADSTGVERSAAKEPDSGFSPGNLYGPLAHLNMAELLQIMEKGKKTARFRFPEILGEVLMLDGVVVHAEQGAFKDEEAMVRLLFLNRGSFVVEFDEEAIPAGSSDMSSLTQCPLDDCILNLETIREVLSALPERDPVIDDIVQLPPVEGRDDLETCLPMPLSDLLVMLPGNLVVNADLFVQQYGVSQEASSSIVRWKR